MGASPLGAPSSWRRVGIGRHGGNVGEEAIEREVRGPCEDNDRMGGGKERQAPNDKGKDESKDGEEEWLLVMRAKHA